MDFDQPSDFGLDQAAEAPKVSFQGGFLEVELLDNDFVAVAQHRDSAHCQGCCDGYHEE